MTQASRDGQGRPLADPKSSPVRVLTIPSDDAAFQRYVRSVIAAWPGGDPGALEARLRGLFPRVTVRERDLSGEPVTWYVYRDGRWRPPDEPWWTAPRVPHVMLDHDGWIVEADPGGRGLLGLMRERHHFTEFVATSARQDATILFGIVRDGHPISATVLLRPLGAEAIAVELRGERRGTEIHAWLRLADNVDVSTTAMTSVTLVTEPVGDSVFAEYAAVQLSTLTAPGPESLALRLRRLYPHATVAALADGRWLANRDAPGAVTPADAWWRDPDLPRVGYDDRGLITEASRSAQRLLGEHLVGRHWQDLVIPGSQDDVQQVLDLLRASGEVVSRFRMPAADGALVEFDSYTRTVDDRFETTMRPLTGDPAGDRSVERPDHE